MYDPLAETFIVILEGLPRIAKSVVDHLVVNPEAILGIITILSIIALMFLPQIMDWLIEEPEEILTPEMASNNVDSSDPDESDTEE